MAFPSSAICARSAADGRVNFGVHLERGRLRFAVRDGERHRCGDGLRGAATRRLHRHRHLYWALGRVGGHRPESAEEPWLNLECREPLVPKLDLDVLGIERSLDTELEEVARQKASRPQLGGPLAERHRDSPHTRRRRASSVRRFWWAPGILGGRAGAGVAGRGRRGRWGSEQGEARNQERGEREAAGFAHGVHRRKGTARGREFLPRYLAVSVRSATSDVRGSPHTV